MLPAVGRSVIGMIGQVALPSLRRAYAAPALATEAVKAAKKLSKKLLIGGQWVDSSSGKTLDVIDPRTEEVLLSVAAADKADVDKAVAAARRAFDEGPWPRMTAKERGRVLYRLADLIEAHAEELALLETLDNGKPLAAARAADVPLSYDHFRYYAGWADKIHGKTIPCDGPFWAYTLLEPVGVVGQIIPWNFPLLMAAWKLAPALACGNTCVLKVAEQTPLSALRLGQLALEAGLPPGVLNIVTGDGPGAGAPLAGHRDVDKIGFTGSTEVGRIVGRLAAENIKPCTLELGGKSPLIVDKDVDLDQAVAISHMALFFNHGQCCAAGSRLYVHEAIYDSFAERAVEAARRRTVGDPFGGAQQGPQVDADQMRKVLGYIEKGKAEGACLATGGARHGEVGYYVQPTVFTEVQDHMAISREEIFGPVQAISKFSTYDEVTRRANDSPYGLASGVLTRNLDVANTLSRNLRAGTVWVNSYNLFDSAVPFGGYKDSGIGREKGEYALAHFTRVKAVYQPLQGSAWR